MSNQSVFFFLDQLINVNVLFVIRYFEEYMYTFPFKAIFKLNKRSKQKKSLDSMNSYIKE